MSLEEDTRFMTAGLITGVGFLSLGNALDSLGHDGLGEILQIIGYGSIGIGALSNYIAGAKMLVEERAGIYDTNLTNNICSTLEKGYRELAKMWMKDIYTFTDLEYFKYNAKETDGNVVFQCENGGNNISYSYKDMYSSLSFRPYDEITDDIILMKCFVRDYEDWMDSKKLFVPQEIVYIREKKEDIFKYIFESHSGRTYCDIDDSKCNVYGIHEFIEKFGLEI